MSAGQRWVGVLTPRQAEIAELIVTGMTDVEVGAELFIAAGTVKYHLTEIYLALGLSGHSGARVKLTRWWIYEVELAGVYGGPTDG